MIVLSLLAAALGVGAIVYLFFALLKPEDF